jgi:predicted ATP-dependent serine protease
MSVETTKISNETIDPKLWEPLSTGHDVLDDFLSADGGLSRGTVTMIFGDPGIGKSTFTMDMLSNMNEAGYNVLFVSAEMRKNDVAYMTRRFPEFADIPVWYVDTRTGSNPVEDFEEELQKGYDYVVVDSWAAFLEFAYSMNTSTKKSTILNLINLMYDMTEGVEVDGDVYYTSFGLIQQVNKSGEFTGSNMLKHLITASLMLRWDGEERYMMFDKNRRGNGNERLYFQITNSSIEFDEHKKKTHDEAREFAEKERKRNEKKNNFDSIEDLLNGTSENGESTQASENASNESSSTGGEEYDIMEDLDVDVAREVLNENNGNVSATHRALRDRGIIPESVSRYYVQKFVDRYGLERRTWNNN